MAKIVIASQTSTSVTVYLGELDTNYSYNDRRIDWYAGNTRKASTNIAAYASSSNLATLSGLSSGTTYTITAKVYKGADATPFATFTASATTDIARPAEFSWTKSIVQQGKDAIIYASDWKELTANINEVRVYRGLSNYSFTKAEPGKPFTAEMYKQAVRAIKGISGYGTYLKEVSIGDPVTAKKLNDLVAEINSVP